MPKAKQNKAHKTDSIIAALCDGLKPVKPLPKPHVLLLMWLGFSVLLVAGMVWVMGMRHDALAKMQEVHFILTSLGLMALASLSAYSGFRLGVPDSPTQHRIWAAMCFGALAFWFVALGYAVFDVSSAALLAEAQTPHHDCSSFVIAGGAGAAILMFVMLHDALPLRPCMTGLAAATAAASLGFIGSVYFCSLETPEHIAIWHMLPVLTISIVFAVIARFMLKK